MIVNNCHNCGKPFTGRASRCAVCRIERRRADADRRRRIAEAALPERTRLALLDVLRSGVPLSTACEGFGVSTVAVHRFRAHDAAWGLLLDEALMAGRDPNLEHGTEWAYRWGKCRCPECREWKAEARRWKPRTRGRRVT
jgi:hypothetical protein